MNVKERLNGLRISNSKINNKIKELENLKQMKHSLGGSGIGERVQSSAKSFDKIGDIIARIEDLQSEINNDIDKYVNEKQIIIKMIDKIKVSEHLDLLYRRYIHNQSWIKIAEEMKYAERTIYKIHGKALKEFIEISKEGIKGHTQVC